MPYSEAHANHAINFIEQLKLTKGRWAGQPFKLLPWEKDLVRRLFGTLREDGTRQYRTAYVEIGKKNGKSELGLSPSARSRLNINNSAGTIEGDAMEELLSNVPKAEDILKKSKDD